jgi:hypothetical protein
MPIEGSKTQKTIYFLTPLIRNVQMANPQRKKLDQLFPVTGGNVE